MSKWMIQWYNPCAAPLGTARKLQWFARSSAAGRWVFQIRSSLAVFSIYAHYINLYRNVETQLVALLKKKLYLVQSRVHFFNNNCGHSEDHRVMVGVYLYLLFLQVHQHSTWTNKQTKGIMDNVLCSGEETSLWQCRAKRDHAPFQCPSNVYVVCTGELWQDSQVDGLLLLFKCWHDGGSNNLIVY